jgi:integrase
MARPATGTVVEQKTKHGTTFAVRYRSPRGREYETVATSGEGMTHRRAAEYLQDRLSDLRRRTWQPLADPTPPQVPQAEPTFNELADLWLIERKGEVRDHSLRDRSLEDYMWAIDKHLRPHFGAMPLSTITAREVDRFRHEKDGEGLLGRNQINKVLNRLASVLDLSVDYGYLSANPARGQRRRFKGTTPPRTYVEPEQLPSLLAAAKDMYDGKGGALLAVLAGCGLRVSEAMALKRGDVNVAKGTLRVRESKTKAGVRPVNLPHGPREELTLFLNDRPGEDDDLLFGTRTGAMDNRNNVRRRLIVKAVEAANVKLAELDIAPIGKLSPHGLRHTYASLRSACGDPPAYTSKQIGHADVRFTLNVYTHAAEHREQLSETAREQYDKALQWAGMGSNDLEAAELAPKVATENPA